MRKAMFGGFMLAALMLATSVSQDTVVAQATKVKKEKKDAIKEKADIKAAGTIDISQGKDEKFRIFVRDSEGKLLAMSPRGFETVKEAEAAIDELRAVVAKAKVHVKEKGEK
jgi:hypothetical protein